MKSVLVIQTAFIGDAILATALLERIHFDRPNAVIDLLIRKGNEGLFTAHPFLNKLLVWDKKNRKYSGLFRLLREVREEQYDAVFNIQRYGASGFLTTFSGAKKKVGYATNPFAFLFSKKVKHRFGKDHKNVHEVDRVLDLWKKNADRTLPKLYPSKSDKEIVKSYQTTPYVTIAPASVWFTKQFPKEKWIAFINAIPKEINIFLIGGDSDAELTETIAKAVERTVTDLCGKLSLLQTAALMKKAKMNYANDSAPVHLASAVNAPICEVFCSTVPEFGFTPLSAISHVVQTKEKLNCRPCGMHGHSACPKGHFDCAQKIDVNEMLVVLDQTVE